MCGIWALLQDSPFLSSTEAYAAFQQIRPRGPDNSYFETHHLARGHETMIGFHRLAIMDDTFSSNQPFVYEDVHTGESIVFLCNGEIYNYQSLATMFLSGHVGSVEGMNDCRVLAEIYWSMRRVEDPLTTFVDILRDHVCGEYAFLVFHFNRDHELTLWMACRDQIGVRPLYHGIPWSSPLLTGTRASAGAGTTKAVIFSSEVKGIPADLFCVHEFPPGYMLVGNSTQPMVANIPIKPVYAVLPRAVGELPDSYYLTRVRDAVLRSVHRRLSADKPLFFLLSGGVDSSLVAALSMAHLLHTTHGSPARIRTACCGMKAGTYRLTRGDPFTIGEGSDLAYARQVAAHIGSEHHEVFFTPQEGIDVLTDVIRTVETWDTTTIRASVGQYMVCRWISQNTDAKVVMVGEGPDEVCSSYLFNEFAPSAAALHETALEYVDRVHLFDSRRVDRCVSRWGLEARVPLLDPEFITAYWEIPAAERMPAARGIEKWWLRAAFQPLTSQDQGILPEAVRMRKKSAFSDSMTSEKSWGAILTEWADLHVTDAEMATAATTYPYCTPQTKEAYLYRRIFCEVIGANQQEILPGYWQPKWNVRGELVQGYMDPSALVLRGDLPQVASALPQVASALPPFVHENSP